MSKMPTCLIADDEAPMRDALRTRLREAWPDLQVVAEAANGTEAIALAGAHQPDIVFLDIRMPGLTGLEAARSLAGKHHVVFVTAYDQYAVEAFERGAADYLLKPIDRERLKLTVERLQGKLAKAAPGSAGSAAQAAQAAQLEGLLAELLKQQGSAPRKEYLRWIQATVGATIRMISVREVLFFRSDEKYTSVRTEDGEYLIRKTLKELEDELNPQDFWRIHRSTLVRADAILDVTRDERGRQMLRVKGYPERLEVSRSHGHMFQQM